MRIMISQMYANIENIQVTANTLISSNFFVSGDGTDNMQIPVMHMRLNAADPTIVLGPRAPDMN
jgi:hypothetical protein